MATKPNKEAEIAVANDKQEEAKGSFISFNSLVDTSLNLQRIKDELIVATKLSVNGITNLVVCHEDPALVDTFLKACFKDEVLYNSTIDIDAVELQGGQPGRGIATSFLDELIFGNFEMEKDPNSPVGEMVPAIDMQTGKRKRVANGFVNRKKLVVTPKKVKDKLLVIKNLDFCLDFCKDTPGEVDQRSLFVFDNFRNTLVKKGCRILLVTNKPLKFPFKVRTVEIPKVDEIEANHIIESFTSLFIDHDYAVSFSKNQRQQIIRKLSGLTYTSASDVFGYAISKSEATKGSKVIDDKKCLKILREKINSLFMEDGFGLTHLTPRPWEDYICPESSNFTYDVTKLLRDFKEIEELKKEQIKLISSNKDDTTIQKNIDALEIRIPHVIVLYGKGGVGKSAFPVHLAGLLEYDIWDFNVNATHSKWIGEGSQQMRDSLKKITNASHVIVRIDEYDRGMGSTSDSGQGMHEAHKQVESEFMNWLQNSQEDSMFIKRNIILVLTTNNKNFITGPLLRSGRSDLVIDIANFDSKSMKTTLVTAARRMKNRGVMVVGFNDHEELQREINKLDLDRISELATLKGFTVRDIEILLIEMATHRYYKSKYGNGIEWSSENFIKVLELSQGSVRSDSTAELVLGDRQLLMDKTDKTSNNEDKQLKFPFYSKNIYDEEKFKSVDKIFT